MKLKEQNNYKQNLTEITMGNKRGQTAIFVIVAIFIVVGGILIYYLFPGVQSVFKGEISPNNFIQSCVEGEVKSGIEMLSKQGGYSNPEGYVLYQGNKIKYLCYTSQYFLPCNVQQPLIKRQFEVELEKIIKLETDECVQNLKEEYEGRGFVVSGMKDTNVNVEIIPEKIKVIVEAPMTISKDEVTQNFRSFDVELRSKLYDLLMISTSLIDFEATYGNTETTFYYLYYPNLIIQKIKLGDGSTVYKVQDVTTKEEFSFASRSLAWPGGYGLNE